MSLAEEPIPLRPFDDDVDRATEVHLRLGALETALATSNRILQPSLRDFLS